MVHKKGHYGAGSIDPSGKNSWRLRYRVAGRPFTKTFKGTKTEAAKELRRLLADADVGQHVAPDRMTVGAWISHWISIGAPGRRKKAVGRRTLERYAQLLRCHVTPTLGNTRLQLLTSSALDKLYADLEGKMSETTRHHVHVVFGSCLGAAVRKKLLARSPAEDVEKVPAMGKFDHDALDDAGIARLVTGFRGHPLYPIVAVGAFTGARLREVLALRVEDIDFKNRVINISRAVEDVKGHRGFKEPKTERGVRAFKIDEALTEMLAAHREKLLRLVAGLPPGAVVDLSLIRLPPGALMFPGGNGADLTKPRDGRAVSHTFKRRIVRLGFPASLRLHDLRGSHETMLLDQGVPVHVVAERCGHDPATMLRKYAKRTARADEKAADVIGSVSAGVLK